MKSNFSAAELPAFGGTSLPGGIRLLIAEVSAVFTAAEASAGAAETDGLLF